MKRKIIHFENIDSTNTFLKKNYKTLEHGTICYADFQTDGKGRNGRVWIGDNNTLMFSFLLKNNIDENKIPVFSLLTAASIYNLLKKYNIRSMIKWPNDIIVNDKKICGILLEGVSQEKLESIIVGIGLNIGSSCFNKRLKKKAISIEEITGNKMAKEKIISDFFDEFEDLYNKYLSNNNEYLKIIRANFYLKDQVIELNYYNENIIGKVIGISDDGKLIIVSQEKTIYINAGEATLHK